MIPENFFSILASKNKETYLDGLFVCAAHTSRDDHHEQAAAMLISELEDKIMEMELDDEEMMPERNISLAHF